MVDTSSSRFRAAQVVLPALLFPVVEVIGVTNFGMVNAVLLSVAFVVFTAGFQYLAGGWSS